MKYILLLIWLGYVPLSSLIAQKVDNTRIRTMVESYKLDPRGPYRDIRWFCKDGTTVSPQERCPTPDAVQRARYKDAVISLGNTNHVFLGQILSTTPPQDFWDEANTQSRLKQYQLEKYLRAVDDGWIARKAQYYRGAVQDEDEQAWGIDFFNWLLRQDDVLNRRFFLVRQAVKDIPHMEENNRLQNVRAVSKTIADVYPSFMDLRVKIHGQPEATDVASVRAFKDKHAAKITPEMARKFNELIADMETIYQPINLKELNKYMAVIPEGSSVKASLSSFILRFSETKAGAEKMAATSDMLWEIRTSITKETRPKARLALLDISLKLEEVLFLESAQWKHVTLEETLDKICYLSQGVAGTGMLEQWEWDILEKRLTYETLDEPDLKTLSLMLESGRNAVEWGAGMIRANYDEPIRVFNGFEPLAYGFTDDMVRSSLLLSLGQNVGELGDLIAREARFSNQLMNIANQSHARGINPGYALGELVIVSESPDEMEVDADKIYVFQRPPADLKPVAGIATVTEGNMVSHVQLLARNLGIPNAVVSASNLTDLEKYSGQKVFYAVSNKGTVIMKPAAQMTATEQKLFEVKQREETKIRVPVDKTNLAQTHIMNLRNVKSTDSGKLCGPKAANLGQLKLMFPDHVVEGLVVPFGIFRQHMDLPMPGQEGSYWQFLNRIFAQATAMQTEGKKEQEIEGYVLKELETLRNAIKNIPLQPAFLAELKQQFREVFGQDAGKVPVFLRSDTNMEDLKDFTGAGLNLTLFNVVDQEKIIQGIKDVWASPYSERSYKWRQRYLLNPENVFPSILIIPSVNVDYSGVLITKGIVSNDSRDMTIAFSKGVGGAVDGQAAESYLLTASGTRILLAPAREPYYNSLPVTGGTQKKAATFEVPILNHRNIITLRAFTQQLREKFAETSGIESKGPFDVELGFLDDKMWLFQVRPFVENKRAVSSTYLESISPEFPENKRIALSIPVK